MTHIHTDTTHMDIGYDEHIAYLHDVTTLDLDISDAWDISDTLIRMKNNNEVYAWDEYRATRRHINALINELESGQEELRSTYTAMPYNDVVHNVFVSTMRGL